MLLWPISSRRICYRTPNQSLLEQLRTGPLYRDLEASLSQELFWCASFVAILGLAMLAGAKPYPLVLAFTIPTALLAVFMSARRGKYDGVLQEHVRTSSSRQLESLTRLSVGYSL